MSIDTTAIRDPQVQAFLSLWGMQHQILRDFFAQLSEAQFDYRMVDRPDKRSDTPRESLAHILEVQLMYWSGVQKAKLEFRPMGVEHYRLMSKAELLAELERIDTSMCAYLTSAAFNANQPVEVPWGSPLRAIDVLYFLRDHDILHVGWNLALMDHLNIPRYESLVQYWGP